MLERGKFRSGLAMAAGAALGVMALASDANAAVFPFQVFECDDCVGAPNVSGEVEVEDGGAGTVTFTFRNTTPVSAGNNSAIAQIYFRNTFAGVINTPSISVEDGVSFSTPATPSNLPAGNTIGFLTFASFGADPPVVNGIENNGSDSLTITAALLSGQTLANVLSIVGNAGIGAHFQGGCQAGEDKTSCSAVTVPLPAAAWLFVSALAGLFGLRRWMRRENSEGLAA